MSTLTQEDVVQYLGNLSIMQIVDLTKELEQLWGVEAKPQFQALTNAIEPETCSQAEPTEFNVMLVAFPADKKITLVKLVREVLGTGLVDSKKLVESTLPKMLKEGASKEEAEAIKTKLTEVGAVITLT